MDNSLSCSKHRCIGRSENKSATEFSLFEDEIRPGVANSAKELSFTEVTTLVLIKQDWSNLITTRIRDSLAANRKNSPRS